MAIVTAILAVVCLAGSFYLVLAALAVRRFVRLPKPSNVDPRPVSILKPLHGEDSRLYENLRSFCVQRHPLFQIVFGIREPGDPAGAVVRRLMSEFPDRDMALVI